jgi:hypothetical protein
MTAPLMQFTRVPGVTWRPVPGPRRRVQRCGLCAGRWPPFFDVPDVVWQNYIPSEQRDHIICLDCWSWLVQVIDGGACQAKHGGPLPLWSAAWRVRHGIASDAPCPFDAETLSWFTIRHGQAPQDRPSWW